MYRYSLDRTSKKFICPQCGKKTFVKYVDNGDGSYLEPNIGRCDRESKCQYHVRPNGNRALVDISKVEPKEPTCLKPEAVLQSLEGSWDSNLVKYLLRYFTREQVRNAISKYGIGTCGHWKGDTVFWHMDHELNLYSGKVMLYSPYTGKRVKEPYVHINWIHKVYNMENFVLHQCLYGIQNLCYHDKGAAVCVVESEKTAIVMSIVMPEYLWLATGSKSNFKESLLEPLRDYSVIAYPDSSEYGDWQRKADRLNGKGFNIACSTLLESKSNSEGTDLADLILG